jgi:type II secretory pathway component PulK
MRSSRREKGAVFVVTLAILAGVTAIVASVAVSERFAAKAEIHSLEEQRARIVAEAGVQRAIETLCDESSSGTTTTSNAGSTLGSTSNLLGATTLQDDWATLGTTGTDRFIMKSGTFRVQILDASSRLNVNIITQAFSTTLPLQTDQEDALLDWISTGETARADGAKDAYYNGLTNPYDASLQPMSTPSEIFDVRYFGPADFYDPPTNQAASNPLPDFPDGRTPTLAELLTTDSVSGMVNQSGTALRAMSTVRGTDLINFGLRNLNAAQQNQDLASIRTQTTWAGLIRAFPALTTANLRNLLNTFYVGTTATPTGKINPNTATAAALQLIPNLTSSEAQSIVNQQTTGITSMGNLLTIPGLTTVNAARGLLDYLAIKSETFIVRVIGTVGSTDVPLEAIVSVTPPAAGATSATAQIIRMEEQPFHDMTGRWGWQATTQNDIQLESGT